MYYQIITFVDGNPTNYEETTSKEAMKKAASEGKLVRLAPSDDTEEELNSFFDTCKELGLVSSRSARGRYTARIHITPTKPVNEIIEDVKSMLKLS